MRVRSGIDASRKKPLAYEAIPGVNVVDVISTSSGAIRLPFSLAGRKVYIVNRTEKELMVVPNLREILNSRGPEEVGDVISGGNSASFVSIGEDEWITLNQ